MWKYAYFERMIRMDYKIFEIDPNLLNYRSDIELRMNNYNRKKAELVGDGRTLAEFANGHLFYGFHKTNDGWFYREWAPGAERMYLTGDFCNWDRYAYPMERKDGGVFELFIPGVDSLRNGQRVRAITVRNGMEMERIPLYAKYVVQDPQTIQWDAVIHEPEDPFVWTDGNFKPEKTLYIYECHIGMAQEEPKIGSYTEFKDKILPRIKSLGYNTIQIMAIMEHPYYASFGYQVTNLFAASSRFGTPEELKALVNEAHKMGVTVLLDVVHSHASRNTREGICEFDGTVYQFFHDGPKGDHSAWGTKCFNYEKSEVIHFLLSNLKFWQEEYHFDGFRFDGVTSMLYHDHGLGVSFSGYPSYFSMNTDIEAITYLQLANEMVRQVNPNAITIAEDTSAIPGLCLPIEEGGIGFDYRLAMGEPDMWIKLIKEVSDEWWDIGHIWAELTSRRKNEKVIGYCESHDQALVGDKTIMFRLCDWEMYENMSCDRSSMVIDRGIALHKLLRLVTMSLGGEGYLTFMGNEFGHPEWIDFPREGNSWSSHYCRRQWSLADNPDLKYRFLNAFEGAMIAMARKTRLLTGKMEVLNFDHYRKIMAYRRGKTIFLLNFHPSWSQDNFFVPVKDKGAYEVILTTDDGEFGGYDRVSKTYIYKAEKNENGEYGIRIYIPSRCGIVLRKK